MPASPSSTVPEPHRRVRGREGGAQHAGHRPVESEDQSRRERERGRGDEGAKEADGGDVAQRATEASGADLASAVEQDHDECDYRDPLDREDLDPLLQGGEEVRGDRGAGQEERRRRNRHSSGERGRENGEREAGRHEQQRAGEVGDLRQHRA
jgi:hypothetical protein